MIPKPFSLENEVALITGGGSGLGLATAKCMVQAGARVILAGRREQVLREAVNDIGSQASYKVFDVTHLDKVTGMVHRIKDDVGMPTILVNNAGIHMKKPAVETTYEEFMMVLNTHVMGAFALTKAIAPSMLERKHGSIVFTASMASLFGIPLTVAYSAAKSAYLGMVRNLATEFSPQGVRVNAIAPGFITSDITRKAFENDPDRLNKVLSRTPMNRMGEAEDIGYAAVYLCSPAAKYITGAVLPVDGGTSIGF